METPRRKESFPGPFARSGENLMRTGQPQECRVWAQFLSSGPLTKNRKEGNQSNFSCHRQFFHTTDSLVPVRFLWCALGNGVPVFLHNWDHLSVHIHWRRDTIPLLLESSSSSFFFPKILFVYLRKKAFTQAGGEQTKGEREEKREKQALGWARSLM